MRWSVIRTIWLREVRDQLRDRRTVFMLVVLPLLLYPLLGFGMLQMSWVFVSQSLTIGVAGHELLQTDSALPPLVDKTGERFETNLFLEPEDRKLLNVAHGTPEELAERLKRDEIQAYVVIDNELLDSIRQNRPARIKVQLKNGELFEQSEVIGGSRVTGPLISSDDDRSRLAFERLRPILREWERELVKRRMLVLGKPGDYHRPLVLPTLAPKAEKMWTRIFPFLMVMMSLTGALYPAIDVCAGEKERGTMETLLISPASRSEIVIGKFLTVWVFSAATALLNLASLGLTAWQFSSFFNQSSGLMVTGGLPAPGLEAIGWCVVLLVPLGAFFSAVCLALAVYARSSKEGQYYLMPLMLVTMMLTLLSLAPGVRLTAGMSMLPVTGAVLLLQALMTAVSPEQIPWLYLAPVLLPLAAYCYLALHWAIVQFNREEVLFREAERLDLALWLKRLFRQKEALPTPGMAMGCFLILLLLKWVVSMRGAEMDLLSLTAIMQLTAIAAPAVLMAVLLTASPLSTLRLRWPGFAQGGRTPPALASLGPFGGLVSWSVLAILLGLALHGPMHSLVQAIIEQIPALKEQLKGLEALARSLFGPDGPLLGQLAVIAGLTAVCEELAFRGFILSGLASRMGVTRAIVASSILFAFAHMAAFQFLPTLLLGLVLGLLATRSGSLLPGILFHLTHNGVGTLAGHFVLRSPESQPWLLSETGLYSIPGVIASAVLALGVLALLVALPARKARGSTSSATELN